MNEERRAEYERRAAQGWAELQRRLTPGMSLTETLAIARQVADGATEREVLARLDEARRELVATGVGAGALGQGDQAPDFTLPDHLGRPVRLADLLAAGPVVLSFYRGAWCPFCNLELARSWPLPRPDHRPRRHPRRGEP